MFEDLTSVKSRLGAMNPRKLEDLYKTCPVAFKLVRVDLPYIISYAELLERRVKELEGIDNETQRISSASF